VQEAWGPTWQAKTDSVGHVEALRVTRRSERPDRVWDAGTAHAELPNHHTMTVCQALE
jgi:hypothetical protein